MSTADRNAPEQGRQHVQHPSRSCWRSPGGTIVAAAEQLRLSPSAVSHKLATLEQEAGVALVDRGPCSLRLTIAGQRLADYAQQIADLMSAARDELSAHGEGRRGLLRTARGQVTTAPCPCRGRAAAR